MKGWLRDCWDQTSWMRANRGSESPWIFVPDSVPSVNCFQNDDRNRLLSLEVNKWRCNGSLTVSREALSSVSALTNYSRCRKHWIVLTIKVNQPPLTHIYFQLSHRITGLPIADLSVIIFTGDFRMSRITTSLTSGVREFCRCVVWVESRAEQIALWLAEKKCIFF